MKLFSFFVLAGISAIITLNSCATPKNNTSKQDAVYHKNQNIEDSLFASLERGFCYGACPVYRVEIYNSGYATFHGKANTDKIGEFSAKFTRDQLNSLTKVAKEINFISLNNVYDNPNVTDLPFHATSIVIDGKRKSVLRRFDYPQSILLLENQIDKIVSEVVWKKVK